jgi:hypothetical protein
MNSKYGRQIEAKATKRLSRPSWRENVTIKAFKLESVSMARPTGFEPVTSAFTGRRLFGCSPRRANRDYRHMPVALNSEAVAALAFVIDCSFPALSKWISIREFDAGKLYNPPGGVDCGRAAARFSRRVQ